MTTVALDLVGIGRALSTLPTSRAYEWHAINPEQRFFVNWYKNNRAQIVRLGSYNSPAAARATMNNPTVLNAFLGAHNVQSRLSQPLDGIGVVSVVDLLMKWGRKDAPTTIGRYSGATSFTTYPAFWFRPEGVDILSVEGYEQPLVHLRIGKEDSLWLMKASRPTSGIELILTAERLLATQHRTNASWIAGVKVPILEIGVEPSLSWLVGMNAVSPTSDYCKVVQAFHKFKITTPKKRRGRAMNTTSLVFQDNCLPYEFDSPFIGFFTRSGYTLPMAVFWADTDSWYRP